MTGRQPIAARLAAIPRAGGQWRGPSYERSRLSDAALRCPERARRGSPGRRRTRLRARPLPGMQRGGRTAAAPAMVPSADPPARRRRPAPPGLAAAAPPRSGPRRPPPPPPGYGHPPGTGASPPRPGYGPQGVGPAAPPGARHSAAGVPGRGQAPPPVLASGRTRKGASSRDRQGPRCPSAVPSARHRAPRHRPAGARQTGPGLRSPRAEQTVCPHACDCPFQQRAVTRRPAPSRSRTAGELRASRQTSSAGNATRA